MSLISTSISGALAGLTDIVRSSVGGLGDLATALAPGFELAGSIRDVFDRPRAPAPPPAQAPVSNPAPIAGFAPTIPLRPTAVAMPGGALMSNVPTSVTTVGLGSMAASLAGGAISALAADPAGGLRSPIGSSICISPRVDRMGRPFMPKLFQFQSPTNPNRIETYVRAPMPRYKVSVSGPRRRRCSGGR